jgi:hypothetical protein
MDVEIAPSNINNVRLKLKRLAERGILAETEQGLFTLPRPQPLRRAATSLLTPTERPARASPQMPPSGGAQPHRGADMSASQPRKPVARDPQRMSD